MPAFGGRLPHDCLRVHVAALAERASCGRQHWRCQSFQRIMIRDPFPEPFLTTDGIHNLRDYGGYAGAHGAKVKTGLLLPVRPTYGGKRRGPRL